MKKLVAVLLSLVLIIGIAAPAVAAEPVKTNPKNPKVLEAVFIHYDKPAKPSKPGTGLPPVNNSFYQIIGPKWDLTSYSTGIPFVINPSGAPSGAEIEIIEALGAWETASGKNLFSHEINYNSWWGSQDGKNNISWQNLSGGTTIAATWIWYLDNDENGYMSEGDKVIENDIVFNASMRWGIDADGEGTAYKLKNMYDVCNIATHEIGHVVGLDDLYNLEYRDLTMYGYGTKAETKKISLEAGDELGTQHLYP